MDTKLKFRKLISRLSVKEKKLDKCDVSPLHYEKIQNFEVTEQNPEFLSLDSDKKQIFSKNILTDVSFPCPTLVRKKTTERSSIENFYEEINEINEIKNNKMNKDLSGGGIYVNLEELEIERKNIIAAQAQRTKLNLSWIDGEVIDESILGENKEKTKLYWESRMRVEAEMREQEKLMSKNPKVQILDKINAEIEELSLRESELKNKHQKASNFQTSNNFNETFHNDNETMKKIDEVHENGNNNYHKSPKNESGDANFHKSPISQNGDKNYRESLKSESGDKNFQKSPMIQNGDKNFQKSPINQNGDKIFSETLKYETVSNNDDVFSSSSSVLDDFDEDNIYEETNGGSLLGRNLESGFFSYGEEDQKSPSPVSAKNKVGKSTTTSRVFEKLGENEGHVETKSAFTFEKETPIEREIRLASERDEEYRQRRLSSVLSPKTPTEKTPKIQNYQTPTPKSSTISPNIVNSSKNSISEDEASTEKTDDKLVNRKFGKFGSPRTTQYQMATNRLKKEILEAQKREDELRLVHRTVSLTALHLNEPMRIEEEIFSANQSEVAHISTNERRGSEFSTNQEKEAEFSTNEGGVTKISANERRGSYSSTNQKKEAHFSTNEGGASKTSANERRGSDFSSSERRGSDFSTNQKRGSDFSANQRKVLVPPNQSRPSFNTIQRYLLRSSSSLVINANFAQKAEAEKLEKEESERVKEEEKNVNVNGMTRKKEVRKRLVSASQKIEKELREMRERERELEGIRAANIYKSTPNLAQN